MRMTENRLKLEDHLLVCLPTDVEEGYLSEYLYLKSHFCGRVVSPDARDLSKIALTTRTLHGNVYLCGDIRLLYARRKNIPRHIKVIKEFSVNADEHDELELVSLGEVPITLHDVAVYYRSYLGCAFDEKNYFDTLQTKHTFQALTESTKSGTSFRKGAYLSDVQSNEDSCEFHLLRCSTNLSGPTLAFIDEDKEILAKVNEVAQINFEQKTELNHVLAQVYENSITVNDSNIAKERKARIKTHSDKTKDMPANGLIAFCTFYSSDLSKYKAPSHDSFDRCYKSVSVLTQLRFKLKDDVCHLPLTKDFRVTLYPDSVLLIPLSTNRLYTHEIVPPTLPIGRFPTRLGYVVRCSKTRAVFRDGVTFIQGDGKEDVGLRQPTQAEFNELKSLYREENITAKNIEYPDIHFSLNEGDYKRPLVEQSL